MSIFLLIIERIHLFYVNPNQIHSAKKILDKFIHLHLFSHSFKKDFCMLNLALKNIKCVDFNSRACATHHSDKARISFILHINRGSSRAPVLHWRMELCFRHLIFDSHDIMFVHLHISNDQNNSHFLLYYNLKLGYLNLALSACHFYGWECQLYLSS